MRYFTQVFYLLLFSGRLTAQQPDWRFAFEYNELPAPFTPEASHDSLLSRLQYVTESQQGGAINVNGGGWHAMQVNETSPINFTEADAWVKRFQDAGYELIFYFTPNTPWSQVNNTNCADGPFDDECAPDDQHWIDWTDYVKAVVERYDGDGVGDLPGLLIPIRFYVLPQEVSFSGGGGGDADDAAGEGFWDDNVRNLVEVHRRTYEAIQEADPSGNSKLVGSGGWFLDLYSDFPDYPEIEGPVVQARLNGGNLFGSTFQKGFDSLKVLLQGISDTAGGKKCDYIGWHPHTGWKATDQSFKFIHAYSQGLPIFIDDMWSAMLTSYDGLFFILKDGYCQFIGGDSIEGDFPTTSISSYQNLFEGLDDGDADITNWYNAKTAREAMKCFATAFGEGAERVAFSLTNDPNPDNFLLYPFSQPYRYTGMVERKDSGFAPRPVMYTMRLLVDALHDFTNAERLNVSSDPHTRVYKFYRSRGTSCYVAWSETGWNTETPEIPNGETVSIPVVSDSLILTHIITQPGITQADVSNIQSLNSTVSIQLGFEPVIIEEKDNETGIAGQDLSLPGFHLYPNPAVENLWVEFYLENRKEMEWSIFDLLGRKVLEKKMNLSGGNQRQEIITKDFYPGIYLLMIRTENLISKEIFQVQ